MIDRKLFQQTFSALHASPDTLSEVYKVVRRNKRHHTITKGMLIAAVLAMCITVAGAVGIATLIKADVAPADSITDADRNAFDKDTVGSDTPLVLGNDGQPISLPRMERASTDTATVQRLLGDYLCTVNATMEVNGYTIKLNTFLIDENGSGFLTYTLSNPNGVEPDENGYGEVYTPLNPSLIIGDDLQSYKFMDAKTYLDTAATTDTEMHLVLYFSDFGFWHKGDDLIFAVAAQNGGDWGGTISISPIAYLPVTTFTSEDGDTVEVSALGIHMDKPNAITNQISDLNPKELVLHMKDGSRYAVQSDRENVLNWVVGLCTVDENHDENGCTYSFNRLVDVDEIESVTAEGHMIVFPEPFTGYEDIHPDTENFDFNYTYTR